MKKLFSSLVIIIVLALFLFPTMAFADSSTEVDGLSVSLSADAEKYSNDSKMKFSLSVANNTLRSVDNIKVEWFLPDGTELARGSVLTDRMDVAARKSDTFSATVLVDTDKKDIKEVDINRADATATFKPSFVIGIIIASLLVLGAGATLLLFFKSPKKGVKVLSAILCSVLILGIIPTGIFAFSDRDIIMYVDKTVEIDGEDVTVVARVSKLSLKHSQDVTIDLGEALYDTVLDTYHVKTDLRTLKGSTFNARFADTAKITVKDEIDRVLIEKEFTPKSDWSIKDFGLIVGINKVEFTVVQNDGFVFEKVYIINNLFEDNMKNLDVDLDDTDSDGVLNYIEEIKGTDLDDTDTDDDQLSDYIELAIVGTDPTKEDTDDNGVDDPDEDCDFDGLTNIEEVEETNTDPSLIDTDSDGMDDKEEIVNYGTDPTKEDTDGDSKTDKWEINKGYDPVVPNESFPKYEAESDVEEIKIEADGEASVTEIDGDLNLNKDMVGNIGLPPFSVEVEKGSEATISIDYDPSKLGGDKAVLYEYNPSSQRFTAVPTVNVDSDTMQFTATKDAVYMLLNQRYIEDVWENDILKPSEYDSKASIDIVFVIDCSGSMSSNDPKGFRKDVAKGFIKKLRDGKDKASIVTFTTEANVMAELTDDKTKLDKAVDGINDGGDGSGCGGAGTNGSAGIRAAINTLENSTSKYKYIVFMTDGCDTVTSEQYLETSSSKGLTGEAKDKGIIIHTVGLIGTGDVDTDLLKNIARATNGNYYCLSVTEDEAELAAQYYEVFDEIESLTIDRSIDTNKDGISDYYTRLICDGKISTSTGIKFLFGDYSYDEVQKSADLDGDGIKNGSELQISESEKGVFVRLNSYPYLKDSDGDGILDPDENKIETSPIKYNATGFVPDINWLVSDDNYESSKYLDFYEDSWNAQTGVFVGNVFFGSNVDLTAVYRQTLVDIITRIDKDVTELHQQEKYKAFIEEYFGEVFGLSFEEACARIDEGDKDGAVETIKNMYSSVKETFGILNLEVPKKFNSALSKVPALVESIMVSRNTAKLQKSYDELFAFIKSTNPSAFSDPGVLGNILRKVDRMNLKNIDDYVKGNKAIRIKCSKLADFIKKGADIAEKAMLVIDIGFIAYDNVVEYLDAVAAVDTAMDNIYILDAVSVTNDCYLNSAAMQLRRAFNDAAEGHKGKLLQLTAQDIALSSTAEILHFIIGKTSIPGAIIEGVRTVGDILFDASENAETAIDVVASANTARNLGKVLNNHLEGGFAIRHKDNWYAYSNYSDEFLNNLLNLSVARIEAEESFARWDCLKVSKAEEKRALNNVEKAKGLLAAYNKSYSAYIACS